MRALTQAYEKALSVLRYSQGVSNDHRRLMRLCDVELLAIIEQLDRRVCALEQSQRPL